MGPCTERSIVSRVEVLMGPSRLVMESREAAASCKGNMDEVVSHSEETVVEMREAAW